MYAKDSIRNFFYCENNYADGRINLGTKDTNKHHLVYCERATGKVIIDGVQKGTYSANISCPNALYIFANRGSTGAEAKASVKISYVSLYDSVNNIYTRVLIPCYCTTTVTGYKGSTAVSCASGTIGLFDLVNKRFYVNSGSGTFTKGADV